MTPDDILALLTGADDRALFDTADTRRHHAFGEAVRLRAVIAISNVCDRQCRYCELRAENRALPRRRMRADDVLDAADRAVAAGAESVVLSSGSDPGCSDALIGELIRGIKNRHEVGVTLALGDRSLDAFAAWLDCGANRCLLPLITTDRNQHKRVRQGEDLGNRLHCLERVRDLGYAVATGVLVGLPGATPLDALRDLLFLTDLAPDGVTAAPFVPRADTPMAAAAPGSVLLTRRMLALLRLNNPAADISAPDELDELRPGSRALALAGGCNALLTAATLLAEHTRAASGRDHVR